MSKLCIDAKSRDNASPIISISAEGGKYDIWALFVLASRELAKQMELTPEELLDGTKTILRQFKGHEDE